MDRNQDAHGCHSKPELIHREPIEIFQNRIADFAGFAACAFQHRCARHDALQRCERAHRLPAR